MKSSQANLRSGEENDFDRGFRMEMNALAASAYEAYDKFVPVPNTFRDIDNKQDAVQNRTQGVAL